MKRSINFIIAIVIICSTQGCTQNSPYDTSTPEKFISALGQVGERPKEENPVPFFYKEDDAEAITNFDVAGESAVATFQAFKLALSENFPEKVRSNLKTKITLQPQKMGRFNMSFSLSASLIRNQIQSRSPSDYEFISATEPDENGIVNISYLMLGKEAKVDVVKVRNQFMMVLKEDGIGQLNNMTSFFNKAEQFFSDNLKAIESEEITSENLLDNVSEWEQEYLSLLKMLN